MYVLSDDLDRRRSFLISDQLAIAGAKLEMFSRERYLRTSISGMLLARSTLLTPSLTTIPAKKTR